MERIYLDHNATTALDPRVFKAMLADLSGPPANPSSLHWFGQRARGMLQEARQTVAHFFNAKPEEILFTSGGTESINLLIRGLGLQGHIISSTIEHSCVYKTLQTLKAEGLSVTELPVSLWGAPLPEQVKNAIRSDTRAIILSAANNETGVRLDISAIAQIAHERQIPFILDAVAFMGKEPIELHPGISAIALSGHKFHAPKGIGAIYLRPSLQLTPQITGGAQERLHRAGTENLSAILGLAEAIRILTENQKNITQHLNDLRLHFENELKRSLPDLSIHGEGPRISNTSNIAFHGIDGETLLMQLDMAGIAVSHGSACASGAIEPSRILTQMGIDRKTARTSIRFSMGRTNTREEINRTLEILSALTPKLRMKKNRL